MTLPDFIARAARLTRQFSGQLLAAATFLALAAPAARAQSDPPGRVGRVAELQGGVSWYDTEQGQWSEAERNLPLTAGDRLSTAAQGSAELRIGSTSLRLGGSSELEVLRLDDSRIAVQLHHGSLALRVRSREVAGEVELATAEARLLPLRPGLYRLDRIDETTQAASWRGELRVDDPAGFIIHAGQRFELFREPGRGTLGFGLGAMPTDAFADAVQRGEAREERSTSARYVSPEMTGAEDLDRYGRWQAHPEFGEVWRPQSLQPGWAPYRYGRWTWVTPWGWTWVDDAPWGFAPFHYGRWVFWRGAWAWVPGAYVARPVYAPALVAWVGGAGIAVVVGAGGPAVGWLPLAPREVYVPQYVVTPVYRQRINPVPPYRWQHEPARGPQGPVVWGNQGVPGALTMMPRDALLQRRPVPRAMLDGRDRPLLAPQGPLPVAAPPQPTPLPRPAGGAPRSGLPFGAVRPDAGPEAPRGPRPREGRVPDGRDERPAPSRPGESPAAGPMPVRPASPAGPMPMRPDTAPEPRPSTPLDMGPAPRPGRPADMAPTPRPATPTDLAPLPRPAMPAEMAPTPRPVTRPDMAPAPRAATPPDAAPAPRPATPPGRAMPERDPPDRGAPTRSLPGQDSSPGPHGPADPAGERRRGRPTPMPAVIAPVQVVPPSPGQSPLAAPGPAPGAMPATPPAGRPGPTPGANPPPVRPAPAPAAPAPAPSATPAPAAADKDKPREGERRHIPENPPGPRDRERERAAQN